MNTKVKIDEILVAMDMQSYDNINLLHINTGNVVHVLREFLTMAEDGESIDDLYDWQQEQMELAYDIIENDDNYLDLPTEFEIHEYSMMEDFCFTIENPAFQNKLLHTIRGKGAFRRFKDKINELDIEQDWYAYRDECYKQIAREFCEKNNLEYED
ncbi:hypothetical protein F9U64_21510 [Gracilibacillus oryzae]|uniref:Uncharacterized protein n=1 Tax=Gracilibacillus oryzae TaxID=1672701 RepID=A0A7C8KPN9_9BACI|nr:UPF0158 family protein [Gracilibacillus oryzae]KAB8125834.1 hypothetical protein F9U64_21510 [Gracilibacillus oryzae]